MTKKTRNAKPKIKPEIKPEIMWVLYHQAVGVCHFRCAGTQRAIHESWKEMNGMPWADARAHGFSAVKVRVEPVK